MKNKSFMPSLIKETARDFIALGSVPFFIIVLVRVSLLEKPIYFTQFLIAGILFLIISLYFKLEKSSGIALIILFFTSIYYQSQRYIIFGSILLIILIISEIYLKQNKKETFIGLIIAGISTLLSNYITILLF